MNKGPQKIEATEVERQIVYGITYLAKQEWQNAVEAFSEIIKLDANNAGAYWERGDAFSAIDDYAAAVADLSRAIQLAPECYEAFLELARVYQGQDEYEYDSAIKDYSAYIKLAPDGVYAASAYQDRGCCYFERNEISAALKDLGMTIQLEPGCAEAFFWRVVHTKNSKRMMPP